MKKENIYEIKYKSHTQSSSITTLILIWNKTTYNRNSYNPDETLPALECIIRERTISLPPGVKNYSLKIRNDDNGLQYHKIMNKLFNL